MNSFPLFPRPVSPSPNRPVEIRPQPASNDTRRIPAPERGEPTERRAHDAPLARAYERFARQLRAAAKNYVAPCDVDDLVQDVFVVAMQHPAKLAMSDRETLSWLIGVAKRCAPSYASQDARLVPLDDLLGREAGDDTEGAAPFAPMPW